MNPTAGNACVDDFKIKVANGDLPKDANQDSYVKYCTSTIVGNDGSPAKETPDRRSEPFISTGEWFVRWGGPSKGWQIIRPNGYVAQEGINTEAEGRNILRLERLKPRSFVEGEIRERSLISVSRINPIFISPAERLRAGAPPIMEKVGKLKIVAKDNLTIQQVTDPALSRRGAVPCLGFCGCALSMIAS